VVDDADLKIELPGGLKGLWLRFGMAMEYWIVTRLLVKGVGPLMKRVFRTPIFFYQIGLGGLLGDRILLLSTQGRKTGRFHTTPLEYGYDPETDLYEVMAGWGGKSDWYRNALINPQIRVWVGKRKFLGRAEAASEDYIIDSMKTILQINPRAALMWGKLSGCPIDGSDENWRANAAYFPMLLLHPEQDVSDFPLQ
jgi:deazaflavin-dependent oxidoreductase (nitroreductase family)